MAPIIDAETKEQKEKGSPPLPLGERFIAVAVTESYTGSDVLGIRTAAKRDGDHYMLNGSTCLISNHGVAGDLVVIAMTGEGKQGLSAFIVDKEMEGSSRGRQEPKFGLRAQVCISAGGASQTMQILMARKALNLQTP
ncbi:MAG: acyl-CoA dehydrogenase family protein [Anaerolineales bacterium]|nr:acyl-CoA dehydrogenase family protein [Anaerolineales bacterium]